MNHVKDKLMRASEIYAEQTLIRAGINAIPYVGGAIDILLSSSGQSYVIKRIDYFTQELHNEILNLEATKINTAYFETEEGFDLIIKAYNAASRTRQLKKLKLYAKIIKGTITEGKEYEEDAPELYLKIIEELSITELRVARLLYAHKINMQQPQMARGNDAIWLAKEFPEFNKDDLSSILVRLEKTGLIKEIIFTVHGSGGGSYIMNKLFTQFLSFVGNLDDFEN